MRWRRRCEHGRGDDGDTFDILPLVDGESGLPGRRHLLAPSGPGRRAIPAQSPEPALDLRPIIVAEGGNAAAAGADERRKAAADVDVQPQRLGGTGKGDTGR